MILYNNNNISIFEPPTLDRPMIVYHPGPHRNYISSWSVMEEIDKPFVLVCDDEYPWYPDDEYEPLTDLLGFEIFTRINQPLIGGRGYRRPNVSMEHAMIHRQIDARRGIQDLPFCDILYLDFFDIFSSPCFDWSKGDVSQEQRQLKEVELLSNHIVDGGYLLVDKKNEFNGVGLPKKKTILPNGVEIEYQGTIEWLSTSIDDARIFFTEVYKIHSKKSFEEPFEFLSRCILERRLSVEHLILKINNVPLSPPPHYTVSHYCDRWLLHLDLPWVFSAPTIPISQGKTWRKKAAYNDWLKFLIEHQEQLRPPKRKEYAFHHSGVDVTIVKGDIFEHADWLVGKNAAVVARKKFITPLVELRWELAQHSIALQMDWSNRMRIPHLRWSGEHATPLLTKEILNKSRHHTVATVAHGLATIEEVKQSLDSYSGQVKHLIIFAIDEEDYAVR
jgi:hypothetical protein